MILFSNEKEIIFKITNAVLLIWLVAGLVFASSSVLNLIVKEPTQNYNYTEYQANTCINYKGDTNLTEAEISQRCLADYNSYKFQNKNNDYYKWMSLYTSIINVVIVGGVMYFINRKQEKK